MSASFTSLGLSDSFTRALELLEFQSPTPIQQEVIPAVLTAGDVLGIAKTGSGKTASYVLPLLQNLLQRKSASPDPEVLVVVPTRELAQQVAQVFQSFIEQLPERIKCLAVFGGVAINPQMQAVRSVDVLVATPGRLLDLVEKNALKLSAVTSLVIDEADKLLNLGFREELDGILKLLPAKRQNLLFSATLNEEMEALNRLFLNQPKVIKLESDSVDDEDLIKQVGYFVSEERKGPLLRYLIKKNDMQQVLVFVGSAHRAEGVVDKLRKNNIIAIAIHGKRSQQTRRETLEDFKAGRLRVLVATDLLARGVDIEFLPCVINYELPRSPKDYIHRIGRTGRAENPGDAISLVTPEEQHHFRVIQKKMGKRVQMIDSGDFNLHGY